MFGRPRTVAQAISALSRAVTDLDAVQKEQELKQAEYIAKSNLARTASEAAKEEAEKASRIATKLREIIEE